MNEVAAAVDNPLEAVGQPGPDGPSPSGPSDRLAACRHCPRMVDVRLLAKHERVCSQTPALVEVVESAVRQGVPPAPAVARRLGISPGAARQRMTRARQAGVELPAVRTVGVVAHGTPSRYQHHKCRCDVCRAWCREDSRRRRAKAKERPSRPASPRAEHVVRRRPELVCVCVDCGYTCELATAMAGHCLAEHGRRPHNAERTPRAA